MLPDVNIGLCAMCALAHGILMKFNNVDIDVFPN